MSATGTSGGATGQVPGDAILNFPRFKFDDLPRQAWDKQKGKRDKTAFRAGMNGVFPSIHSPGDVEVDITAPVLLRSNLLAHGPQSSDYACADLDDGSSNIITSSNIMIGCAMKNREGDLRTTVNNLIMGCRRLHCFVIAPLLMVNDCLPRQARDTQSKS